MHSTVMGLLSFLGLESCSIVVGQQVLTDSFFSHLPNHRRQAREQAELQSFSPSLSASQDLCLCTQVLQMTWAFAHQTCISSSVKYDVRGIEGGKKRKNHLWKKVFPFSLALCQNRSLNILFHECQPDLTELTALELNSQHHILLRTDAVW